MARARTNETEAREQLLDAAEAWLRFRRRAVVILADKTVDVVVSPPAARPEDASAYDAAVLAALGTVAAREALGSRRRRTYNTISESGWRSWSKPGASAGRGGVTAGCDFRPCVLGVKWSHYVDRVAEHTQRLERDHRLVVLNEVADEHQDLFGRHQESPDFSISRLQSHSSDGVL